MQTSVRYVPLGFQQFSGVSTLQSLTVPSGATVALITVTTNAISWRDDGTAPTAAIGNQLAVVGAGSLPFEYSGNLSAFQFIPVTGSATVNVSYYRVAG